MEIDPMNPTAIPLKSARKTYNTPVMVAQGKANEMVQTGASNSDAEACDPYLYNLSGPCP